jgi:FMN-dependent NADH-azoreductase
MITVKELIIQEAEKLTKELQDKLREAKKIALDEAWRSLQLVVAGVVQTIEAIAKELEGKEKKAIAMEYINIFYDKAILVVDIPLVPSFVEAIIHSYVKKILMIMVSASIDATVSIFRQTGVFLKKGSTE